MTGTSPNHTPAGVTRTPGALSEALGSSPVRPGSLSNTTFARNVRRSYLGQPCRYSGDVASITGEETRAAPERSVEEGGGEEERGKVSAASFRLV